MTWSKLRLDIVVLTFIIVSALAFGGQYAYLRFQVEGPTVRALEAVPGVKAARIERDAQGKSAVRIKLQAVPDFAATYKRIVATAEKHLGGSLAGIIIEDGRDEELVKTYSRMNFAVEEGIATGRFTKMAGSLQKAAREAGLDRFDVWVDEDRVYLSLENNHHWLYQAVSRRGSLESAGAGVASVDRVALPEVSIVGGGAS